MQYTAERVREDFSGILQRILDNFDFNHNETNVVTSELKSIVDSKISNVVNSKLFAAEQKAAMIIQSKFLRRVHNESMDEKSDGIDYDAKCKKYYELTDADLDFRCNKFQKKRV